MKLTPSQHQAVDKFHSFLANPKKKFFIINGGPGTGKTALVKYLHTHSHKWQKMYSTIKPEFTPYTFRLCATTHKAAGVLAEIIGNELCTTIHKGLGLYVVNNSGKIGQRTSLAQKTGATKGEYIAPHGERCVLFIDEASYIDQDLLSYIRKLPDNIKVCFIGDHAQLTLRGGKPIIFLQGFEEATLTDLVRQKPGTALATFTDKLRDLVITGEYFAFKPDGVSVEHVDGDTFNAEILKEYNADWKFGDAAVLTWTNKAALHYNYYIRQHLKGSLAFLPKEWVLSNCYVDSNVPNGQLLQIDKIQRSTWVADNFEVKGFQITFVNPIYSSQSYFLPHPSTGLFKNDPALLRAIPRTALPKVQKTWVDLRPAYAFTVNKAQGSTFDTVFINLNDIARCNARDTLTRLIYVAVSRARHRAVIFGDL